MIGANAKVEFRPGPTVLDRMQRVADGLAPEAGGASDKPPLRRMTVADDPDDDNAAYTSSLPLSRQTWEHLHHVVPGLNTTHPDHKLAAVAQHLMSCRR